MGIAGNSGGKTRSDCQVTIEPADSGGIVIDLKSKVKVLYGTDIIKQIHEILGFYSFVHAKVTLIDSGALSWVIAARIEAAVRELIDTEKTYLLPRNAKVIQPTVMDRRRFSRLYLPGNSPSLMINAFLHGPDGLILDLEDSVPPDKKPEARVLVRNALRALDFGNAERMIRINQLPAGLEDLNWLIPHGVNLVLLPKCESAGQVLSITGRIEEIKQGEAIDVPVWIMPIIESAKGVVKAYEIASASQNVVALAIGLEDYTADLGVRRTGEAAESLYARSVLVNAAKAAGIQAIDSVFSDVDDMEGLRNTVKRSRAMGFDGMGCIHPRQIPVIHENYTPDAEEIDKAKKIVIAFMEAQQKGLGVVALGSKMIDPPVVKRARKTIAQAIELSIIENNWYETRSL
ncbi:MAG: citrate lyase ACP [Porphyromonadaceae bacterium]|nr:MAG: citrate lyase ACP [Porphyromonadaceae bacterium]